MAVTSTQYKKRLATCRACPDLVKHKIPFTKSQKEKDKAWQCSICGCFVKLKAKLSSQKCPEGKWPKI